MKKFLFLIPVLFLFVGCDFFRNDPDDLNSYKIVDYSSYVKEDCYEFPPKTDSVTLFNCFYSEYGYCEKKVTGVYTHTESAVLNGKTYSDTITKNISKIKIYTDYPSGGSIKCCYVVFTTDSGETMQFLYEWQFHVTNYWHNDILDGTLTIYK